MNGRITGRNAVLEAIKSGREIDKIVVATGSEGSISKIVAKAREKGIVVSFQERKVLDRLAEGENHQGVVANVAAHGYAELDDLFKLAKTKGEEPFVLILDGIEDPHNLGAIIRSAECVGAHGVIIPKRQGASLTDTVARASAGAIEHVPCVKVTNIVQTIDELKKKGLWVVACDMGGELYNKKDLTGSIAVVIGGEGKGVGKLVRSKCDFVVSIPLLGRINSLNASNAAAVLMYEVRRQRDE